MSNMISGKATALFFRGRRKSEFARFCLLFALFAVVFYGALALMAALTPIEQAYTSALANITGIFLAMVDKSASVAGNVVYHGHASGILIGRLCTGIIALVLYCAGICSLRGNPRKKLYALGSGVVIILIINELRLIGLFLILAYRPGQFDFFHAFAGQGIMVAAPFLTWFYWAQTINKGETKRVGAPGE
jgi:exosortase/archaeosortase family protein